MEIVPTLPGWNTERLIGRGGFGSVYEIQRNVFGDIEKCALVNSRLSIWLMPISWCLA